MEKEAKITVHPSFEIGEISPRLFSTFLEPIGTMVNGTMYNPKHPTADEQGFRKDGIEALKSTDMPAIRLPGGNFVSAWDWKDSIGPKEQRKVHLDPAWYQYITNEVGHDEYLQWAEKVEAEPMYTINLGTGGIRDAMDIVEYTNHEGASWWSDLRKKNGHEKPYGVKVWYLGNEMDGPWQLGHKTMEEYGRLAEETAKAMKLIDPSIELVSCGSSALDMPTFPKWESTTLENTYDYVDYVSMHQYYGNRDDDTADFLACSDDMDEFIRTVIATCDYVRAKKRGKKNINISFDEWNVWFHSNAADDDITQNHPWQVAPPMLEDIYTFEDALLVGLMLITLLKHADRVKIACMAQLVNVIAPIMTDQGGGAAWKQTIFYPFLHASRYGRGVALMPLVQTAKHDTAKHENVTDVESVAVYNEEKEELTIFAVNRTLDEDIELTTDLRGMEGFHLTEHIVMEESNLKLVNSSYEQKVVPKTVNRSKMDGGIMTTLLGKASWNVIRLSK